MNNNAFYNSKSIQLHDSIVRLSQKIVSFTLHYIIKQCLICRGGSTLLWFIEPTNFLIDLLWFSQKYSANPPGFTPNQALL